MTKRKNRAHTWAYMQHAADETKRILDRRLPPETPAELRTAIHIIATEAWSLGYLEGSADGDQKGVRK